MEYAFDENLKTKASPASGLGPFGSLGTGGVDFI